MPDPLAGDFIMIFDAKDFWSETCALIREVLNATGIQPESIRAVSATAMRFAYVFLDDRGEALYSGPNLDGRGFFTQEHIENRLGPEYYQSTGQWPPLTSALARLIWFEQNAVDVFSRIRTILMLNDWMLYKLCGEKYTEVTAASASGVLNVADGQWSEKIRAAFDLDQGLLPPIAQAGQVIGEVLPRAAEETGLHPGTPVVVGGGDTQCALLGAGMQAPGEVGVVAGTTAPVCLLMDSPYVAPERRFWTSCHLEPNQWILEANGQWAGYVMQWMKDLLLKVRERPSTDAEIYAWMEEKASAAPPGSGGTRAFLGPAIADETKYYDVPPGIFHFPPPAHPVMASPARGRDFLRSLLENIAFALRGNHEQLLKTRPSKPERVYLTGGLANSRLFCQIVSDCLDLPVFVGRIREASGLGAAICAAVGIGAFSDITEAQKALVHKDALYEPTPENTAAYQTAYEHWREIYEKLEQI
jgi:autoinducer 2 (AI-2) kinase